MIPNYEEIINNLTHEEAMEIVSKMGMNMTDHPYLSEERKAELEREGMDSSTLSTTQTLPPEEES